MAEEQAEKKNNTPERREFPRLNTAVDIGYKILNEDFLAQQTITKNISAGGICLIVYEQIAPGTILALDFYCPVSRQN